MEGEVRTIEHGFLERVGPSALAGAARADELHRSRDWPAGCAAARLGSWREAGERPAPALAQASGISLTDTYPAFAPLGRV